LGREHLDLYQIHWPSGTYGTNKVLIEETLSAMNTLKKQGKIRAIGVSNFSLAQLQEAMQFVQIESIQLPYSLLWRHLDRDIRPFCEKNKIVILGYSALAQGMLSGRFSADHVFDRGDNRLRNVLFSSAHLTDMLAVVGQYKQVAASLNVSVGALALAWVHQQPNTAAIVGAKRVRHLAVQLEALGMHLDAATHAHLSSLALDVIRSLYRYPKMWQ
jgi:aryl-alcohol dehydrogenase-like predicted oxidoreductase